MEEKYRLGEDPERVDGTRVFTVDKVIEYYMGIPVVKTIFRGTKEECTEKLNSIRAVEAAYLDIDNKEYEIRDLIARVIGSDNLDYIKEKLDEIYEIKRKEILGNED